MYFILNNGIDIVKGANRSLIVNTNKNEIFYISNKFYKIISLCQKGKKIEKLTNNTSLLLNELQKLEMLQIGKIASLFTPQILPSFERNIIDMVWLPLTDQCNYKCLHCYENARFNREVNCSKLTLLDYKLFFDKLTRKYIINCVQLTGGEPMLMSKTFLTDLIKLIKTYKIQTIEFYSNLSLLDMDFISLFKKYNIQVATSFYSINENIHDKITGVKGSYKTSLKAMDVLSKNNIPFRIGVVIMEENKDDFNKLRKWLNNKYNLQDEKMCDIVRPIGRGQSLIHIPQKLFSSRYINSIRNIGINNFQSYYYNKNFNSCWGNKICLKSDGNLYPCVMSKYCMGNYKRVEKILNNKNSYRFLTKDKIKVCNECEFRYLCNECRAMYAINKVNLSDKPFTCTYNPCTNKFKEGDVL